MISHRHSRSSYSSPKKSALSKPSKNAGTINISNLPSSSSSRSSSSLLPTTAVASTTSRSTNIKKTSNLWLLPIILCLTIMIIDLRTAWRYLEDAGNIAIIDKQRMEKSNQLSSSAAAAAAPSNIDSYHNSAAICVIQKGALRYIDEWVYYNLWGVGFDHIYFYDNSDDYELEDWYQHNNNNRTNPMHQDGRTIQQRISIQHFPGPNRQNEAYTDCAKQIQMTKAHSWIAFIDVDEFLVLRNRTRYSSVMEVLNALPVDRYAGLAVSWVIIGMNRRPNFQPLPVTMRFPKRAANATDVHIKTIARTDRIDHVDHPHYVAYERTGRWLNRQYQSLFARLGMMIWELLTGPMIVTRDLNDHRIRGPWNKYKTVDDVALYHYHTKSLEEYKERCSRGRADVPEEDWAEQLPCQPEEVIKASYWNWEETIVDDLPWQLLQERVPSYANQYVSQTRE